MDDTYQKASGSAGSKGVDFQVNLLSIFLLNALRQNIRDWKLSTENKQAGKFDDVVLELSDGDAILLQAKHKENKKTTLDQLLSTNSKNEDFSLPKYFFSYLDNKTKFPVKSLIICTNTQADARVSKYLNRNDVSTASMLHCEGGASFSTFNDNILLDLITNARVYNANNLKGKGVDEALITEENAKEFLKHLQFYSSYPSGDILEKATEKLLSDLKPFGSLSLNASYRDIYSKVKDWFEQSKGEYLTERRAGAMFCEIKTDKCCQFLEDYKIFFKSNDFKITDSKKRIIHVVAEGVHLLHLIKVYRSLEGSKTKALYADSDCDEDAQQQMIKAFELPQYTYLVIVSPKFSEESVTDELYMILSDILNRRRYKKVVFVAERHNILVDRMKSILTDHDVFEEPLTLEDLSEDAQQMLLQKKSVIFQGEDVSLEELLPGNITDDHRKSVHSGILEKLVRGEKITVGVRLADLEEEVSRYYVNRRFKRPVEKVGWNRKVRLVNQKISERDIYDMDEKMILISDSAGTGKTTVLAHLAARIKKNNPHTWVVRIELNRCTDVLSDSLKNNRSTNVWELLNCKDSTNPTNDLEELLFSLKANVVLMLDGVDEIGPDYTELISDLLLQSQKAENFAKVFVTTRTHMAKQLQARFNVTSFRLVPLTEQNQIDFLTRYWMFNTKLEASSTGKCERYVKTLISKVSSWIREWYAEDKFVAAPLHARMLAEVFLESKESEEWQGCREYLDADGVEPVLPEKMNIARLYDMFMEKKRDIFIDKGNPSGNATAKQALKDQFEECLAHHRSLALKTIIQAEKRPYFSSYKRLDRYDDEVMIKVLKMGIVQRIERKLIFVHRTFAEYFVAQSLLEELQLPNQEVEFQTLLIDEILFNREFKIVRHFVDNFLRDHIPSLAPNIFRNYKSAVNDTKNSDLLHGLASEGNAEIIRFVLRYVDFKVIRDREVSSIDYWFFFTKENTLNILSDLVKRGGINIKHNRRTPLHEAAMGGHLGTVKFLVDMGADVNNRGDMGNTALHHAVHDDDLDMAEFLVERDADVNIDNYEHHTVLQMAAARGNFDIVKLLLAHGAGVNVENYEGYTALHLAAERDRFDVVELLVRHGVDVNIANKEGCTALHFAAEKENFDIVKLLVTHNVDVNVANEEGYTALHTAVQKGSFDIVELLADHDADVNVASKQGYTTLYLAAERGRFDIVELLVGHNALSNIASEQGYTALHFATERGSVHIVELLVRHGADINIASKLGDTALHFAVERGLFDIVQLFVNRNADTDVANNKGNTALHLAAERGSFDIVELLANNDADTNIANKEGYTALHFAVERGSFDVAELLVKHNADINLANGKGYTALHFAVEGDYFDIVELLVQHNVDVNIADEQGYTALDIATQRHSFDIVELFAKHAREIM